MRIGFTGSGLDRADHLRLDESKLAGLAAHESARLLILAGLDPVLGEDGRLAWVPLAEGCAEELIFLGLEGDSPLFAPLVRAELGQRAWSVFRTLGLMTSEETAVWGAARSLIEWHNRHLFCGRCGSPTMSFRGGWGRRCGNCRLEHFPRIDPVVIMLAEHDGKVLIGRQPQYPAGRFSALAGFVEPGESIEEAVAREIREEAGLIVSNVRYIASQPWPFPGQLMIACVAEAATHEVVLDRNELDDAMWVDRAQVRAALDGDPAAPFLAPPHFAIAHSLLRAWAES